MAPQRTTKISVVPKPYAEDARASKAKSPSKALPSSQKIRKLQEAVILVMGATGSGKSTFINLASSSDLVVGNGLKSCTSTVQPAREFKFSGKLVTLIDTPGFDDSAVSEMDILKTVGAFLSALYESNRMVNGVIYMHRITDIRIGGTARRNFEVFKQLCGTNNFTNIAIVTNMWNEVSMERGTTRELELKEDPLFFRMPLEQGATMFRHDNTAQSARSIISHLVKKRPITLRIQRELVDDNKDICETAAAIVVQGEMEALTRKHEAELEEIREDMRRALGANDWMARRELEEAQYDLERRIRELQDGQARLPSDFAQEKARAAEELRRVSAPNVTENQWRGSEPPFKDAQLSRANQTRAKYYPSSTDYDVYPSKGYGMCCVIM